MADKVPADKVPADKVPADKVPADKVPADNAPADRVPWEELQRAWQESPAQLPELEKLLRRRSWAIWFLTGFDVLFTVVCAGWLAHRLKVDPSSRMIGFAVFFAVLVVVNWCLMLWIRRGTWRLHTAAPADMVELSIRRCRASIHLAWMNQWVVAVALLLAFLLRHLGVRPPELGFEISSWVRGVVLLIAASWFVAAGWYRRRKVREMRGLLDLRREMTG